MEKNSLEVRRQVFHLCLGIAILVLLSFNLLTVKILFAVFLSGLFLSLLSLRYNLPLVCWFLDRFERDAVFPGKGVLFFFLGSILSLLLFSKSIALASISVLTFGDSISPLVGFYFGRLRSRLNGSRFIEGFVAGFVISSSFAYLFVPFFPAILGSFVALFFEFLEVKFRGYSVDDNILIPLVSGSMMYLVMVYFGGNSI